MYSKAATQANHKQVKEAVELLIMSGLVIPVTHTAANGVPLGAEADFKKRKMILLDTGVFQRLSGLAISEILFESSFDMINRGAIAEQFAGLELLKSFSCYRQENLYFWHREAKSSNAEVDYVVQKGKHILPLEIKSGKKGSMQSMYLFFAEKNAVKGIRISLENYSRYENIEVYPLYAIPDLMNA